MPVIQQIGAVVKGMATTAMHMFRRPETVQYPEVRKPVYPRFRGRHRLERYENGLERCIGCSLCAGVCPAKAIYVEAAENTDEQRFSPGERYARGYEINMIRCIFCGYCQEVCPTEAIVLGPDYELADYDRPSFVYTKEMLLVPDPRAAERTVAGPAG